MTSDNIAPVVLFSGGRTSGYMLHMLHQQIPNFRETHRVIFCNTGRELPQTLQFVKDVEDNWGIPVTWLEYTRVPATEVPMGVFPTPRRNQNLERSRQRGETVHWFKQVTFETASRNGEPFDELLNWMSVLPNVVSRGCSVQLKIRTAMRYLFSVGLKEYRSIIGIRHDESHRGIQILASCESYEHPTFPLVSAKVDETMVLDFWRKNAFDLQLRSYEGNCDFCFLKAKYKRVVMARKHPEKTQWWLGWEDKKTTGAGAVFRRGEPFSLIQSLARTENHLLPGKLKTQVPDLEADKRIRETDPQDFDIACSCAEKGFGPWEEDMAPDDIFNDPIFQ